MYSRLRDFEYAGPALLLTIVLLIVTAFADSSFLSPGNWGSSLAVMSPFILVAMAQSPAVISGSGGLDLSVGPLAAFVGAVVVAVLGPRGIDSPLEVVPIVLVVGAATGAVNGMLVAYARIPPVVATLGTYLMLAGLALEVLPTAGGTAPHWLTALSGAVIGPVPGTLLLIAGVVAIWSVLQRTAYRRNLFAVGAEPRAAFTAGIDVARVQALAYVLSGTFAAVTGLAFVALLGAGDATVPTTFTLISLAGAAVGGVALAGGRGGLLGAATGGAVLFLLQNTLSALHVNALYTQAVYGGALLVALSSNLLLDVRRRHGRMRSLQFSQDVSEPDETTDEHGSQL
ncbi:ABC transporter permease [Kribbella sp. VKM Ac-2566]|uniref:ABC transporter permease n=1 Tax=Kribbella sp. VKM Ac-2566 TaxID=2512218 RepID=UPI00106417CB|nr:ABC transporter permease [Kribbella sp. VKM Ac-2566]TDX08278.1 ribose transport system permease protein [Kribbella sp. VKM Ac-2566]